MDRKESTKKNDANTNFLAVRCEEVSMIHYGDKITIVASYNEKFVSVSDICRIFTGIKIIPIMHSEHNTMIKCHGSASLDNFAMLFTQ